MRINFQEGGNYQVREDTVIQPIPEKKSSQVSLHESVMRKERESQIYKPTPQKRPWQGRRPSSGAGSRGNKSGSQIRAPHEMEGYDQSRKTLEDMGQMLFRYKHMDPSLKESLTEELSLPQKRVAKQNHDDPENFEDVSEPRDSYMGARETYKHDNSPAR